jgi:hypothetical protein
MLECVGLSDVGVLMCRTCKKEEMVVVMVETISLYILSI